MRIASVVLLATITMAATQQPPSVRSQQPVRDRTSTQDPAGTGVIKGKITNADGRPLRRVRLVLSADPLTQSKNSSTDSRGRFELTGAFAIRAVRPSDYLAIAVASVRSSEWNEPDFRKSLRERASHATVSEGQTAIDLPVSKIE